MIPNWGRIGFDGDVETKVAGRGAAGLVKSGKAITGNVTMQTAKGMIDSAFAPAPAMAVA